MRRVIFLVLAAILAALVAARAWVRPPEAAAAMAEVSVSWDPETYNVLDWGTPEPRETAGSAFAAEMAGHFLSRRPTAKHPYTGALTGRNLVLILAEDWKLGGAVESLPPGLARLWREGTQFTRVYAPDWYQGRDGREFALLTGLTPTTVQDRTSMTVLAEQGTFMPFSLGLRLGDRGYTCRAYGTGEQEAAYRVLGLSPAAAGARPADDLAALGAAGPFFLYWVLEGPDGETALEGFRQALEAADLADSTAICLAAGSQEPLEGWLFLWSPGLEGTAVTAPCSELDVTPTLLDLFGAAYDSRFLSGRDLFADGSDPEAVPLVSLYGSAYADWVTDAGFYTAREDSFAPADRIGNDPEQASYVRRMQQEVYDRYIYSRRILESNYFRLAMGG